MSFVGRLPRILKPSFAAVRFFAVARTMSSDATAAAAAGVPKLGRFDPATTVFFLCDIQERFRPLIHEFPSLIAASKTLV